MLNLLQIENVAVIEKAEIEFERGLSVLTGETGAGKSIIIDALGAVLGGRTSHELVRSGAPGAVITAVFDSDTAADWCAENGIDCDETELVLVRKISAEGKSSCRVNGSPVSVAQLRALGSRLLDIHGQNDGQKLLSESYHLSCLDSFAGLSDDIAAYRVLYEDYRAVQREIDDLTANEAENARRVDTLHYQIDELENARIQVGELDRIESRLTLLRNAGKLSDAVNEAYAALYGSDDSDGAISLMYEAESSINGAARLSDDFSQLSREITSMRYEAEDIAARLYEMLDNLDFTPDELDELELRREKLRRLSRKYGSDEEEMLLYLDTCLAELDRIEFSADKLQLLQSELEKKRAAALSSAQALSEKRRRAADELSIRVRNELRDLSMPGVEFLVEFIPKDMDAKGIDDLRFLMSANAGEPAGRISRIASGGELARIILALKNVLSENEGTPTMVFDEIDTGVSGIAAQRVGEKLSDLASEKQVLCVTHLPQIAAMADNQFCIEKTASGGRTYTVVKALDRDGRKREIARLTGGENITDITLKSAEEQISAAEAYRAGRRRK